MWNSKAFLSTLFPFCIPDLFVHCISVDTAFHFLSQLQPPLSLSSHCLLLNAHARPLSGHFLSVQSLWYFLCWYYGTWSQLSIDWSCISRQLMVNSKLLSKCWSWNFYMICGLILVTLSLNTLEMLAEQMLNVSRIWAVCTFIYAETHTHILPLPSLNILS